MVELEPNNGDVWSAMGHCFLMQDELQKAYMAYQQALYFLENPKVRVSLFIRDGNIPRRPKISRWSQFASGGFIYCDIGADLSGTEIVVFG